jgi:hypothetical protein
MRRTAASRLFAVTAIVSIVGFSSVLPAGAVIAKGATCTKATFKTDLKKFTSTSVMSGCTNPAATGGTGTLVANFKNLAKITTKITWKGTGTTSYLVTQKVGPKTNKCKGSGKTKDVLIVSTGKFTAGTGAVGAAWKGTVYTESLCVTKTNSTYLLPGSKITFK